VVAGLTRQLHELWCRNAAAKREFERSEPGTDRGVMVVVSTLAHRDKRLVTAARQAGSNSWAEAAIAASAQLSSLPHAWRRAATAGC